MTMPVFALLTAAAVPQTSIGGQSALTDYSEGQQSYSEDVAELLATMETALALPETEVQLPAEAKTQSENEELVQSMLAQPLLFDPLPVAEDLSVAEILVGVGKPPALPEDMLAEQAGDSSVSLTFSEYTAAPTVLSAAAFTASRQQQQISTTAQAALITPLQQSTSAEVIAVQTELQQKLVVVTEQAAPLVSQLNQPHYSDQTKAFSSAFTLSQNNLFHASLSKTTSVHQAVTDMLTPVSATATATSAASSALPVWQADPLPTQSQHWGQRLVQLLSDKVDLQLGLNVNKAMIRLDPPSLGSIELSVQLDGDRLTVQMHSSNAQLREAMGQGLEQLRASLQQKLGADVQIELRMGSDSSSQQQQQKFAQQLTQQAESNFHTEPDLTQIETSRVSSQNLINQLV